MPLRTPVRVPKGRTDARGEQSVSHNGDDPAAVFDRYTTEAQSALAGEVENMRALLEGERNLERRLSAQLEASRDRRRRLEKVVALLTGETDTRGGHGPKQPGKGWSISDGKIAEVWELVRHRTDSFTSGGLASATPGLSPESARRALLILRERELLRIAGTARGGGSLLAIMPGAAELNSKGEPIHAA